MTPIREVFQQRVRQLGGTKVAAEQLGCSRTFLYMVFNGDKLPGRDLARRIEDWCGIPMRSWDASSLGGEAA